jgi:hypothetical protein
LISISESEFCRGVWNSSRLLTGTQNSVGKENGFSIISSFELPQLEFSTQNQNMEFLKNSNASLVSKNT